jgi:hypothetical protein
MCTGYYAIFACGHIGWNLEHACPRTSSPCNQLPSPPHSLTECNLPRSRHTCASARERAAQLAHLTRNEALLGACIRGKDYDGADGVRARQLRETHTGNGRVRAARGEFTCLSEKESGGGRRVTFGAGSGESEGESPRSRSPASDFSLDESVQSEPSRPGSACSESRR